MGVYRTSLADVLQDIVDRLLLDDWEYLQDHPGPAYYVLGVDAFYKEQSDIDSPPRPTAWAGPRPGLAKYLRGLVAAPQNDYLKRAFKRFRELGIATNKEAVEMVLRLLTDEGFFQSASPEVTEAGFALLDAVITQGQEALAHPPEYFPGELESVREKQYLREITLKYKSLLSKLNRLTPLQFSNPQLQEATRCWLYGFYRASMVLSASALEEVLKIRTRTGWLITFDKLVGAAESQDILQGPYAEQARRVFRYRSKLIHESATPTSAEAEQVLIWVRGILAMLAE